MELLNTLTDSQLGTNPDTQTHHAINSLFAIIPHNKYTLDKPTYVAFVDYSTAYPFVHRDSVVFHCQGMWKHQHHIESWFSLYNG